MVRKLLVNQIAVTVVHREFIADCVTPLYQRGIATLGGQSKNVLVDDAQKLRVALVCVRHGCREHRGPGP